MKLFCCSINQSESPALQKQVSSWLSIFEKKKVFRLIYTHIQTHVNTDVHRSVSAAMNMRKQAVLFLRLDLLRVDFPSVNRNKTSVAYFTQN